MATHSDLIPTPHIGHGYGLVISFRYLAKLWPHSRGSIVRHREQILPFKETERESEREREREREREKERRRNKERQ